MNWYRLVSGGAIVVSLGAGLYLLPVLPDQLVVRWGVGGQPTGFMNSRYAVLFLPLVASCMLSLSWYANRIDPLGDNYASFNVSLDRFVLVLVLFLSYLHGLVLMFNTVGLWYSLIRLVVPAVGILFASLGSLLKDVDRNWLFGIQTPWTMRSERVWEKTNVLAGKLFQLSSLVVVGSLALRTNHLILTVFVVVLTVVYSVVYSYLVYRRVE